MQMITPNFLVEMKISGTWTDITRYVVKGSLRIDPELNSPTICELKLNSWPASPITAPQVGHQFRISDMQDGVRAYHFGGLVADSFFEMRTTLTEGPFYQYSVKLQDYSCLLDRSPVTATFTNTKAGDIVKALIAALPADDQLDTTNVDAGPVMSKVVVPSLTPKEALDELNRLTGYKYWITHDRKLYYKPKGAVLASWDLTPGNRRIFGKPRIKRERGQYRNVQEVRGAQIKEDKEVYFPPNTQPGVAVTYGWQHGIEFFLFEGGGMSEFRIDLGKPIVDLLYVNVGASPDFGGEYASIKHSAAPRGNNTPFFYDPGSPYVYLADSWTIGEVTQHNYDLFPYNQKRYVWCYAKHQTEVRAIARKDAAWCRANGVPETDTIDQMAAIEGTSGIVSKVEVSENLTTVEACQARANQLLKDFGVIATVVDYISDNWGDLAVGQQQHVDLYNVEKDCTVRSVRIRDVNGVFLRAQVTLVGSESPNFAQYWKQITAGKTPGMQNTYAMRRNEIAAPSLYLSESLSVSESLTISTIAAATAQTFGSMKISTGGEWS